MAIQVLPPPPISPLAIGLQQMGQGFSQAFMPSLRRAIVGPNEQERDIRDLSDWFRFQAGDPEQKELFNRDRRSRGLQPFSQAPPPARSPQGQAQVLNILQGRVPTPMQQSEMALNAAQLQGLQKQTEMLGQTTLGDILSQEKTLAEIDKMRKEAEQIGKPPPETLLDKARREDLEKRTGFLDEREQAELDDMRESTRLKRSQAQKLATPETLTPDQFRHQWAIQQGFLPGTPEYKNAVNTLVRDAPVQSIVAKKNDPYGFAEGTLYQVKADGTITVPNKVLIQQAKRPGREWYEPLNQNIAAMDNIDRLRKFMRPGKGGADSTGVRDAIFTRLQKYTGLLSTEKAVFSSDRAMMYKLIKQASGESRMSDQDLRWLAAILPSEWQSDEAFVSVLDSLRSQAQSAYDRDYEINTAPEMMIPMPSTYKKYYSGGQGQSPSSTLPSRTFYAPNASKPRINPLTPQEEQRRQELLRKQAQ